jgi:hypothetical protein
MSAKKNYCGEESRRGRGGEGFVSFIKSLRGEAAVGQQSIQMDMKEAGEIVVACRSSSCIKQWILDRLSRTRKKKKKGFACLFSVDVRVRWFRGFGASTLDVASPHCQATAALFFLF